MRTSSLRFSLTAALLLLSTAATAQNPTTSSYLYLTEFPTALYIQDIQGRVIEAAKLDGGVFTWKPANLAGGIYFLTLSNRQATISRKVVFLK